MRPLLLKGKSVQGHPDSGQDLFGIISGHKTWALKINNLLGLHAGVGAHSGDSC